MSTMMRVTGVSRVTDLRHFALELTLPSPNRWLRIGSSSTPSRRSFRRSSLGYQAQNPRCSSRGTSQTRSTNKELSFAGADGWGFCYRSFSQSSELTFR